MKHYTPIVFIVLLLFFLCGCKAGDVNIGPKLTVTAYGEKVMETKYPVKLDIACDYGAVEVYTWGRKEVKFEVTRKIRGTQSKSLLEEKLKDYDIKTSEDKGKVTFTSRYKGSIKSPADKGVDLKVYLPKKVDSVSFKVDTGSISFIDDMEGTVTGEVKMADVKINRLVGSIHLNGDLCSIRIENGKLTGKSDIKVNMGNIAVKAGYEEGNAFSFITGMGNIEFAAPSSSQINIEPAGTVKINEFPYISSITKVNLKTEMGEITIKKY